MPPSQTKPESAVALVTEPQAPTHPACFVFAWTLACWLLLIPVRGHTMGYGWYWVSSPISMGRSILAGAYLDLIYLACAGVVFTAVLRRCRSRTARTVVTAFLIVHCVAALLWGIANIQLVAMLGQPLNYAWLYNSGLFRAFTEPQSLLTLVPPMYILQLAALLLVLGGLAALLRVALKRAVTRFGRRVWVTGLIASIAYCGVAAWYHSDFYRPMLQNPIVAFASSLAEEEEPELFRLATDIDTTELQVPVQLAGVTAFAPTHPDVRNVLLIILESVGAQHLPAYGSTFPVTPELDRLRSATRIYDSFYAHAPNTNKSMFSYLCSLYPAPSYILETIEYSDARFASLPEILKNAGYRTGFFYSADLRYGDADLFLAQRSLDTVKDARTLGDGKPTCIGNSGLPFSDAMDDTTLMRDVGNWIGSDASQPFFAAVWTSQTHYPYFVMDEPQSYTTEDMYNRYLNGLRETDAAIGALLAQLESAGQLDATLVVIVGDHGEAFGQHKQWGHGNEIYQENVHVPLLLINRHLFKGERDATVGGGVDLAPTILDVLRLESSPWFQGRSLFDPKRSPRSYFMTAWSGALYGYREGDRKYIYNAKADSYEVFDIARDPGELSNLADQLTEQDRQHIRSRLAAWVQYQRGLLPRIARPEP